MQWDFWTLSPESAHQVTFLMTDRGTPEDLAPHARLLAATPSSGRTPAVRSFWVKYHFKTDQGIENFTDAEATAMIAGSPISTSRDLFNSIASGNAPEWRLEMQIMPFEDAADYRFNPFDLTKVWPHGDYPPVTIGRMVLDRNPENYFAEVEQAAFEPANMVPGNRPEPGQDAARAAVQLSRHPSPSDRRQLPAAADQPAARGGPHLQQGRPDALPARRRPAGLRAQLLGRPRADPAQELPSWMVEGDEMVREAYSKRSEDDDFGQPGDPLARGPLRDRPRPSRLQHRRPCEQRGRAGRNPGSRRRLLDRGRPGAGRAGRCRPRARQRRRRRGVIGSEETREHGPEPPDGI